MRNKQYMKKRPISEELLYIWALMLYEKMDNISKLQENEEITSIKYQRLEGYKSGYTEAMALLTTLEQGRFQKDYDRLKATLQTNEKAGAI